MWRSKWLIPARGISESNQAAIFRRFYREEEVHDQQGVGIGLYLAREIVTRQGGYIKVVSEPGMGSEFFHHASCKIERGGQLFPAVRRKFLKCPSAVTFHPHFQ